ncbi:hypothetical protein GCM10027202_21010 [Microvirgula curvata]|nr:hypothetical protein [Microvirgula aerodenitrificans]
MQAEPTADALFASLRDEAGAKFVQALEKIKGACDAIVAANGTLTYSQVGKVAVQLYGGPKVQSILNNAKHKAYIDARKRELSFAWRLGQSEPASKLSDTKRYPADSLDYKTRRYIDDLRQRNSLLEAAMRELKKQVLKATERKPLDLSAMLAAQPSVEGLVAIKKAEEFTVTEDAKEAIRILIEELPKLFPEIEVYQSKALRLRTGEWLLAPAQYAALKALRG